MIQSKLLLPEEFLIRKSCSTYLYIQQILLNAYHVPSNAQETTDYTNKRHLLHGAYILLNESNQTLF